MWNWIVSLLQMVAAVALGLLVYAMQVDNEALRVRCYYVSAVALPLAALLMFLSQRGGILGWLHNRCFISGWETNLRHVLYLRFQILVSAALVCFPFLAVYPLEKLLKNLFIVSAIDLFFITWMALLVAISLMVATDLTYRYAWLRFDDQRLRLRRWLSTFFRYGRILIFGSLTLPTIAYAWWYSQQGVWGAVALAAGLLIGWLTLYVTALLRERLVPPGTKPSNLLLDGARLARPPAAPAAPRPPSRVIRSTFRLLGAGYFDVRHDRLLPGHILAFVLMLLVFLVYVSVGVGFAPGNGWNATFPALGYLLILLMLAAWALPALAFFLDRWRIPTLISLVGGSVFLYSLSFTDHYFETKQAEDSSSTPSLTPTAALAAWFERRSEGTSSETPRMIVVVASGGGITAATWTAVVMTGLERELGADFTRSLGAISAVSGGSVGLMYYLDGFNYQQQRAGAALDAICQAASSPSLRAASWGVAYPDLLRATLPPLMNACPTLDRGWAMQETWRKQLANQLTLRQWRSQTAGGLLPTIFLNATAVETGQQFLLTPIDLPTQGEQIHFRDHLSFLDLYPHRDLEVVVAARMSATFPWVTPIARPTRDTSGPGYHLADGGYYDNYGVITMVQWLEEILPLYRTQLGEGAELLVIRINAWDPELNAPIDLEREKGWAYALYGPLTTLVRVRGASQVSRIDQETRLLTDAWKSRGLTLKTAQFNLTTAAPLSWKLSPEKVREIRREWTDKALPGQDYQSVKQFLQPAPVPP